MVSKKASNKAIGARAEAQFKELLHAWGFLDEQIEKARPTYKPIGGGRMISSQNDFYNEFDFMVKHKRFTIYVQVKAGEYANTNVSHAKKKMVPFIDKYGMNTDIFIIAQKEDRKGFKLIFMNSPKEYMIDFVNFKGYMCDENWESKRDMAYDKNFCRFV